MMNELAENLERILPLVSKPAQYLGDEINVVRKNHDDVDVRVVLAFPDAYEIGQSYVGFHILYHLINRRPDALAERAFAPWVDMEERMRSRGIPLFSLESKTRLSDFDLIGFTLQYELTYTNILNMLHLADIPLCARDRDERHPLVVGGGMCAYNPEPLAPFFDLFVLGDGEEVIGEIIDTVREGKRSKLTREEMLNRLAEIEGIYVPSLYEERYGPAGTYLGTVPLGEAPAEVRARFVRRLAAENYPDRPLVPLTEIVHDRLSVEVMRGCTRGCRFCQAGMAYRPLRERSAEEVVDHAIRGIEASGWDEVSLVSLCTSDYTCLLAVCERLNGALSERRVALSLPSMRPESFSSELAELLQRVRRTGLTFAPEVGTERLRRVVNKEYLEEDLLEGIRIAYASGWNVVKLYFMIGLPTESEEDLEGIVSLVRRAAGIGRKAGGGKRLNVSISPFSPKPNTPFQWDAQDDTETLRGKIRYLTERISGRSLRLKWRNPEVSLVEAAFARGGRRCSDVVAHAWRSGAKFDSWTEFFDFERWERAFRETGLVLRDIVGARSLDAPLPWDHLSPGIRKEFLLRERRHAASEVSVPDCRDLDACAGCGIGRATCEEIRVCEERPPALQTAPGRAGAFGRRKKRREMPAQEVAGTRIRIEYTKRGGARLLSHLDLVRGFDRSIRRVKIPIAYSQGYHPHPKIAFGPPLALGIVGMKEYVDLQLSRPFAGDLTGGLGDGLPSGVDILRWKSIFRKTESLNASIVLARYEFRGRFGPEIEEAVDRILQADELIVRRGEDKVMDIRRSIEYLSRDDAGERIFLVVRMSGGGSARPREVLRHLFGETEDEFPLERVVRTGLFIERDGRLFTPMEVV